MVNRKRIVLASNSAQRKRLLKLLGLKFIVSPSAIKESNRIKTTCASLVKDNALRKARDVARKFPESIVIGADTLVYSGDKKILGKPKDLIHAKRMLKTLSRKPQWVYTGLAVMDTTTKKIILGCEKTKVFMNSLSDKQIDSYHRFISPLDKAGGFDIEHKGGLFIRRIEGCYFNVVGLPVARLCAMLRKVGVHVFSLAVIFMFSGCATEYNLATQQQETLLYGTDKEVSIGESIAREFDKQFKINTDIDLNERVSNIARKIVEVCDRQELVYTVKIIDDDKVNAVSLPGGFIYIFRGILDKAESDDELACVIAHEVGHITAKHAMKKIEAMYGYTFLKLLAVQSGSANLAQGVDAAFATMFTAYSQEDEFMSDRLGIKYAQKAGYDPNGMANFLKRLKKLEEKDTSRELNYWRTHPYTSKRISAANQEISGGLEFRDYLNLTGEK
ncbi:MAG: Maf family nucleotide pyrophosphatase [Candidatus Omnitrophota bacterium]